MSTQTELEAGPELDALVAEVIGVVDEMERQGLCVPLLPQPYSTDWNAFMRAAEAVGLFKHRVLKQMANGDYQIDQGHRAAASDL